MALAQKSRVIRILFWNVNKKDLTDSVCSLVDAQGVDVLVLNENAVPSNKTLRALQKKVSRNFYIPARMSEKRFHCFCRNRKFDMSEVHSSSRFSVRQCTLGSQKSLVALVHCPDMRNYDEGTRQAYAQTLATQMAFVKKQQQSSRLVLLGDFNMNPYDRGMNLAAGLNAMMTKQCVSPGYREHLGEKYDFYYNPMWSLFGDNPLGPAGTVYDTSNQGPYGWSIDPTGQMFNVRQLIADVKSGTYVVTSAHIDDMKIAVYGDTSVVFGLETEKSKYKGEDMSGQYRFTDTWVKRKGQWVCVASANVKVVPPKP